MERCHRCTLRTLARARWAERGSVILIASAVGIVLGLLHRWGYWS
jgi:hypothetical protein